MKISEDFIKKILKETFPNEYQTVYDESLLLQYLDKKMRAVHGDSKTRRSLASIYAIYSILHFYQDDFFNQPDKYREFDGYDYMRLFTFYRSLYGGSKLQNLALNSRVNGEFRNKFPNSTNDLIVVNNGKYMLHIDYLYIKEIDISKMCCKVIEKYVELLMTKDHALLNTLQTMQQLTDYSEKKEKINALLTEDAEARIFEIISYAILKNHYSNIKCILDTVLKLLRKKNYNYLKQGEQTQMMGALILLCALLVVFFK